MTRRVPLYVMCLLSLAYSSIFSQIRNPTLAVMDFEALGISYSEGKILVNRLRNEIAALGRYTVVEREKIERILQEQEFGATGCTTNECLVETGRILNVRYIVGGSIGRVGNTYSISMRMIDVETANIEKFADYDYTGAIDNLLKVGMKSAANRLVRSGLQNRRLATGRSNVSNRARRNARAYNSWVNSGKYLTITLNNGSVLKGRITATSEQRGVTIQTIQGYQLDIPAANISTVTPMRIPGKSSAGLGIGMAYGGIGMNLDITLASRLVLTLGYGTWPIVGEAGYAIGVRLYFADKMKTFRPRISYLYGINSFMYTETTYYSSWSGYSSTETLTQLFTGSDLCLGFEVAFGDSKKHGLDFDIAYIFGIQEKFDSQIEEWEDQGYELYDYQKGAPIDLALGYRYRF